jgi:y4mF family transcriptional regulator
VIERDRLFDEISGFAGLRKHRSPIDELMERTRNLPLSAIEQLARGNTDGITEAARRITQGLNLPSGTASTPVQPRKPEATRGGAIRSIADLGPLIRKARKAMKLNQAQFAAHAGVGRRFLSELEGGKPSLEFDKVLACAAAAGIDLFARPRSG